ncbi:hypothetical protein J2X06_001684 [Lysobacter niastensis]|uniref:Uncharacterized protein n=1 Tax=Lysobacter niastensis TaxID=380629 RepID=A0ABU1WAZ5_9GAMM|nr:hypothetical protein [Lysobacter niastensis]MDR7134500.1 hypothetical protein [Lysobacter niastensis]
MNPFSLFKRSSRGAGLALAMSLALAPAAQATKLQQQNLTQLIAESDSIIGGIVRDVHDGIDETGVPYTEVTISVGTAAKGNVAGGQTYTFRQFGLLQPRVQANGHRLLAKAPEGFPTWREGEYAVAFLYKPASITGLQTTVGLAQGKLSMVNDKLVNEFNNVGLFEGVEIDASLTTSAEEAMLESSGGAVDLRTFMALVGHAVEGQWVENGEMK